MNNIGNRANSLWQKLKIYSAFLVRYIVFVGRKKPLVAIVIIALYCCFFYQVFLKNKISYQSNLPLPTPIPSSQPTPTQTSPNPTVVNNQLPQQSSVTEKLKEKELAKIAAEERQINQKRIEASKEKLKQGNVFTGELIYLNSYGNAEKKQPIKLEIKAIIDSTYLIKFSDPNNERVSQIFEGNLVEKLTQKQNTLLFIQESNKYASLYLRSRSPQTLGGNAWSFYEKDSQIVFVPTNLGFDGKAEALFYPAGNGSNHYYKIVLRSDDFSEN